MVNWFIRVTSIIAVLGIAVVAGWVSYTHGYHVALAHHEGSKLSALYPLTVDGLIYAASMVVLDHSRRGIDVPALARWVLWLGITVAVGANIWFGWRYGWTTALVAAWPAPSLVLAYELLMRIIRNEAGDRLAAEVPLDGPVSHADETPLRSFGGVSSKPAAASVAPSETTATSPTTSHRKRARHAPGAPTIEQAQREFAYEIQHGVVPSKSQIQKRLRVGADKAESYQRHISEVGRANREAA